MPRLPVRSSNRAAAARNLVWVALESGGVSLISFATLLILARLIGPQEFGVAGLALSIVLLLYAAVEMLFHDALVQRPDLDAAHADSAFWTSVGAGVALMSGCWLAGPALEQSFAAPGLAPVLGVMSLCLPFAGVNGVLAALLRRDLAFKRVATRSLAGRMAGAVAGLVLALTGFGVWALVAQQVAMTAGSALALCLHPPHRLQLRVSQRHLLELLRFALPAFTAGFLWQANLRLFVLAAGLILGTTAVGYLTVAMRVVDTARGLLGSALHQLALPLFARRQSDRAALVRGFREATELAALVTQPLFAGLFALAPEVVAVCLGSVWEPSVPLIRVLCVVAMVQLLRQFGTVALTAVGRPGLLAWQNVLGLAVSLGLLLLAGPYGALAAMLAWAARFVAVVPFNALVVSRVAGIPVSDQMLPALLPVLASGLMAAALMAARADSPAWLGNAEAILLLTLVGSVLYIMMVGLVDRGPLTRLLGFVRSALGPRRPLAAE
ncbi:lipopolysaccharide biosynthesis protein [Oleisolibacter albus]|uniref:lipopolysaccharide biosynthesis protein n=1 Tax=Oleisolibacter albus TaxID=2171757 RepID=UPI00138FDFA2|nr:lipopolysaccharide biosynthesis protein [Oleisolibacter albus]